MKRWYVTVDRADGRPGYRLESGPFWFRRNAHKEWGMLKIASRGMGFVVSMEKR